jgi:hypothetical protein
MGSKGGAEVPAAPAVGGTTCEHGCYRVWAAFAGGDWQGVTGEWNRSAVGGRTCRAGRVVAGAAVVMNADAGSGAGCHGSSDGMI